MTSFWRTRILRSSLCKWTSAGQRKPGKIRSQCSSNPGRYELWHVKDMNDIKTMPASADEGERMQMGVRAICPVGLGDIDYKPIFAAADIAGMKHFCVEQDDAAEWGHQWRPPVSAIRTCCASWDNITARRKATLRLQGREISARSGGYIRVTYCRSCPLATLPPLTRLGRAKVEPAQASSLFGA